MAATCSYSILDSAIAAAAARLVYEEVKPEQREAVRGLVNGRDVFVTLPTGFGKSLCYAMLPLVFDSVRGLPPSTSIVLCVFIRRSLAQILSVYCLHLFLRSPHYNNQFTQLRSITTPQVTPITFQCSR